ncbi:PQQ-binding-like beta-propeller repeat protein [Streptomyces sp. R33]|uniref:PQQ-binding-like beta-propeller repeat protein n=1 Tax=Streptomyces sp. R33 TaxID=3238629 RepID=A0AB39Y504_9ACTN
MPPLPSPLAPLTHDDPVHLGGHRLLARLGSGGMGTVYLARSAGGRTVALKTVHTRIAADTSFRTRFRLESDAARVIGDRYGARVFGADPLAPTPWLATEYVIGPQLDEAVRLGGPLPEASVRSLGADLARALGQLHRSDVVHRDLKPSNIMVTAAGPKVIDFGIARALGDERLTSTGAAAGTPAFMSPEQAGGLEHTPAGDVFALAGVLVFAATGHGPFGGGQAADLLYRVRYAEADLGGVPAVLAPLLARCLSKDPALRPGTGELAELLSPGEPAVFADGLPQPVLADIARRAAAVWQPPPARLAAPAEEPETAAAARTGLSRRRLLTLGGGAAVAGTVLAAGGGWWAWRSSRPDTAAKKKPALQPPPDPLWWVDAVIPPVLPEPLCVGDALVAVAGTTVGAFDARTGSDKTEFLGYADRWRVGTDGKVLYGLGRRDPDTAPDKAVAVSVLPMEYVERGKEAPPRVRLPAFDGAHRLTQILGASGDTVFLHAKAAGGEEWWVVAASLTSGKELWRRPAAGPTPHQIKLEYPAVLRLKAVRGGVLLWQRAELGDDLRVSLHDAANGTERWSATLAAPGATPDQPATDDDHVYLGAATVQALRLSDGKPAWSFGEGRDVGPVAGKRRYGIPTVRDGVVYAVEGTHGLVALDARTGAERWREPTPKKSAAGESTPNRDVAPVATPNHVYLLDTLGVRAVDLRTHLPVWRYETKATTLTPDPSGTRLHVREKSRMTSLPTD